MNDFDYDSFIDNLKIKCPVCGKKEYVYIGRGYDGYQPVSPAEGTCESCGFSFQENGSHSEEQQARIYKKDFYQKDKRRVR